MAVTENKNFNFVNGTKNISLELIPYKQIISDEVMWHLNVIINISLSGLVSIFGTFSNIMNMVIFFKLGLKDSMSVCLFSLAITDGLLSFIIAITRIFPIWMYFFSTDYINPMAIQYVCFSWLTDTLFLCSGWITTFLSLERCVCVLFPFKVKHIFTRYRSIVVIVIIYIVMIACCIPIYLTHSLGWVRIVIETGNGTVYQRKRLVVKLSENRREVEHYMETLSITVIPLPSLVIIIGSVLWMTYGLIASSQLRETMTSGKKEDEDSKLTLKTRRLIKVVLFLAITFTICSIPRLFATMMSMFNKEADQGGKERNLSMFQWQFARIATAINASVNVFVYLKVNSSYRAKFMELFSFVKRR